MKDATGQRTAIEPMIGQADFGDFVFSFDRCSNISYITRKLGSGPWSHVGIVSDNKQIIEATTDRVVCSDSSSRRKPSFDVGLYRSKAILANPLSEADKDRMRRFGIHCYERSSTGAVWRMCIFTGDLRVQFRMGLRLQI
jgi:cell wall-associated NlpC family hydrolase